MRRRNLVRAYVETAYNALHDSIGSDVAALNAAPVETGLK